MRFSRYAIAILAWLLPIIATGEEFILSGPKYPGEKAGIMVWVRDDRSLLADFGVVTIDELVAACERWRKQGTEPFIRIILFPSLPSNRDLDSTLGLLHKLNAKKIEFDIVVCSPGDEPERDLITKKPGS